MEIELLWAYDFGGIVQHCIRMQCACGYPKVFSFQMIKNKERTECAHCGCRTFFSPIWIEKIELEFNLHC